MIDLQSDGGTTDRVNGRVPDVVTGALALHARGLDPVRLAHRSKRPIGDDWPAQRYEDEAAIVEAFVDGDNVGVLLGGGIADVDLDSPEALRLAGHLLPPTESIHGRASARASHRWYSYPDTATLPTRRYRDPAGAVLLELRADRTDGRRGLQTMAPPSIHPTGEAVAWEIDGTPGDVTPHDLARACDDLAAASLLCRAWPRDHGGRHDLALALGGMLARGGCDLTRACHVVEAALRHGGADAEWADRIGAIRDSYAALGRGDRVTGMPSVARLLGDDVARTLRDWLGLSTSTDDDQGAEGEEREERRPRFRLLTDAEIESRTPPDMLVAGVVPAGGLGIMWGAPGSLKTFAMLDIAMHVQTGREWHGRNVRQGRILYVVAEGSAQFGRRVAAWKAWRRVEGDTGALWLADAVQLREHSDIAALVDAIEGATSEPIAMIVLDTLSRCAVGAEENSATDTGLLIAGCDMIRRRTGASTWLIHHSAKNGLHERGSSALRGAADVMISANVDGDLLTLRCDKAKDVEPFVDVYMRRRVIEFPTGATSLVLDPVDRDEATVRPASVGLLTGAARDAHEVLTSHFGQTGATATEWRLAAGMSESTFYRARSLLLKWEYARQSDKRYWAVT